MLVLGPSSYGCSESYWSRHLAWMVGAIDSPTLASRRTIPVVPRSVTLEGSRLQTLLEEPKEEEAFEKWLTLEDVVPFLVDEIQNRHVLLYLAGPHAFVHGVLVPRADVEVASADYLLEWHNNTSSTWAFIASYAQGTPSVCVGHPLDDAGKVQRNGEQLVFSRFFEGRREEES